MHRAVAMLELAVHERRADGDDIGEHHQRRDHRHRVVGHRRPRPRPRPPRGCARRPRRAAPRTVQRKRSAAIARDGEPATEHGAVRAAGARRGRRAIRAIIASSVPSAISSGLSERSSKRSRVTSRTPAGRNRATVHQPVHGADEQHPHADRAGGDHPRLANARARLDYPHPVLGRRAQPGAKPLHTGFVGNSRPPLKAPTVNIRPDRFGGGSGVARYNPRSSQSAARRTQGDHGLRHRRALHRHEGQLVRRGLSGRLHPSDARRARLRPGQAALHRPGGVHRLRRLRRGLPGRRLLRRGSAARRVAEVHPDQRWTTTSSPA